MTEKKRVAVYVDDDMAKEIDNLKQSQFYNQSYSALLRQVIKAGLDKLNSEGNQ